MCATILYHNKLQQMCLTKGSSMTELQELRRYRRDLHRIPELDFDLPQTIAYIEGVLAPLACEVTHPCPSCVCAFFDAGVGAAHATAIRADMDALPIAEATGAAFASTHPGKMHACGHDGHMAMALAAATYVDRTIREQPGAIRRNVLFVFQPAEETTGGAKTVCESGVFERYGADRIFGFHVWPDLPAGTLASCSGPLLARSSETHIHIHGTSIHIAKTYGVPVGESHDAALAAAKFLVAERELMDELGTDEPCIGKFGLLQAGTVCNAVAGRPMLPAACVCLRTTCSTVRVRVCAACLMRHAPQRAAHMTSILPRAIRRSTTTPSCLPTSCLPCPSCNLWTSRC